MEDSILTSTKKALGLEADYTAFDPEIVMHINSVFGTLVQLGIGPVNGFMIEDATPVWSDFLGEDKNLNPVKTYMYQRVRLIFDPPATSFAIAALEKQIEESAWRINVHREDTQWASPIPPNLDPYEDPFEDEIILDGGTG